jgi:hypothetical protein
MDSKAIFEEHLATFCKLNAISMSDPSIWSDVLSHGLLGVYMPAEFVWENRKRPWDWEEIKRRYEAGSVMFVYRGKSWSWQQLLYEAFPYTI